MKRRVFLSAAAGAAVVTAGCTVSQTDDNGGVPGVGDVSLPEDRAEMDFSGETLQVSTYGSFVDAPSDSPGAWIKDEFEQRYGVTLEWNTPEQDLTYYVERNNEGVDIDAEVYLGVRPQNFVRADRNVEGTLFRESNVNLLRNGPDVGEEFFFDPQERAVPTFLSHCAIVYDGRKLDAPETFEDLTDPAYSDLLIPNPARGTTGLLFLLWTIDRFGADGYLEYWRNLIDNGARILDSWGEVYTQFQEGEAPVIVSYSNDRVFAQRFGNDLDKHRVALLDGQGYANLAGMARFADSTQGDLAYEFMDFVLEPEVQSVIAERNVTGPVNEAADPPAVFQEFARQPDESVFYGYEDLEGELEGWVDGWSREIAGQ
jgi:thiamine transport system substrate-binding protein